MNAPFQSIGIGEIARRYGLTLRTLRFYEQCGLLEPIRSGSDRYYTPRDEVRIKLILKGKRFGFSLQEIRVLIDRSKSADAEIDENDHVVALLDEATIVARKQLLEKRMSEIQTAIAELSVMLAQHSAAA